MTSLVYYNRTIAKDHHLGLTLLQSAEKSHYEYGNIKANVDTARELWYNTHSLGDPLDYSTGLTEDQLTSYMVRANYNYQDKYLLTASVRWDGDSDCPKATSGPASQVSHWDGASIRSSS